MARAGALSRSCICLCMCVSVWSPILFLCVSNPLIKKQKETNVLISLRLQQFNPGAILQSDHSGGSAPPPLTTCQIDNKNVLTVLLTRLNEEGCRSYFIKLNEYSSEKPYKTIKQKAGSDEIYITKRNSTAKSMKFSTFSLGVQSTRLRVRFVFLAIPKQFSSSSVLNYEKKWVLLRIPAKRIKSRR